MNQPDPYAARRNFFALAHDTVTWGAIIRGIIIVEVVWLLTGAFLVPWSDGSPAGAAVTFGNHALFLSIVISTFWITRRLQNRNPLSLFGPPAKAASQAVRVLRALGLFLLIFYGVTGMDWNQMTQAMPVLRWLLLLPIACLAVLIQCGAEEIFYRGYLQQSIGAKYDHPVLWMVLPSLLFGIAHYDPQAPSEAAVAHVIWATVFGLAAADLTARSGTIGPAIGLHFANNLPQIILVALPGGFSGFSLFLLPAAWANEPVTATMLGFQLFFVWMMWMVCRIAIRR